MPELGPILPQKSMPTATRFRFDGPLFLCYPLTVHKKGEPRYDTCWRKPRIAARILPREEAGKLTVQDVALGHKLAQDNEVTPRLIEQAIHGFKGRKYQLEQSRRQAA
jgi:hypothetical protein